MDDTAAAEATARSGVDETLAAVDLGSNSFHMVIGRITEGRLQIVDRLRDMVRLGGGLMPDGSLSTEAQARAIEALERMGQRLRAMPPERVRAVGTNTLRQAKRAGDFLHRAEEALGHPIEIISGREEARLIYLGVAFFIEGQDGERRLVLDIGGGSTELIVGEGFEPLLRESKYMGCVSYSQRFFPDGQITREAFDEAVLHARQQLQPDIKRFRLTGWQRAIGSSGTNRAAVKIVRGRGGGADGTSLQELYEVRDELCRIGHVDRLDLSGLSSRRAPVFPGGLAILIGIFESLGLERMRSSDHALREGLLYDLRGRLSRADIREQTIEAMAARYGVDQAHAERVEEMAVELLAQVAPQWGFELEGNVTMLRWAARIHEIGLAVAHSRYHKHGSYLVENSDMPGFSRQDQHLLWALVRSHRRRLKPHRFDDMHRPFDRTGLYLCLILRLAVVLNRSRVDGATPTPDVEAGPGRLALRFPKGWLQSAPLTAADLEEEAGYLKSAGFSLTFS